MIGGYGYTRELPLLEEFAQLYLQCTDTRAELQENASCSLYVSGNLVNAAVGLRLKQRAIGTRLDLYVDVRT